MAFSLCQSISRLKFDRLCAHSATQPDFVFLGSQASSGRRGLARGFSSGAVEQISLLATASTKVKTQDLIREMEQLRRPYLLSNGSLTKVPCPLIGGWVGSLAYELGYAREARLNGRMPELPLPLMFAGLYLWFASEDMETGSCYLWVHPKLPETQQEQLTSWLDTPTDPQPKRWFIEQPLKATQSPDSFRNRVQQVRDYIQAGDCYQANLSQSFEGSYSGDPWLAFRQLTQANPTPYAAFLRHDGNTMVSVSPERFLAVRDGVIATSPIKGTRRRGATPEQDKVLAEELLASEKDRAENLMIVDLLRNDLGVNARPGSVKVDELFALESYENVHHLVSHIRAELAEGVSPLQALFDAFPGGSITGAPKIRAMEIINELEPHWRGPYCGSVFYYGLDGRLDSNIAIRTLLCERDDTDASGVEHGTIRCWGGGGIVADSEPEAEYQETLTKVKPLMDFLENLKL